MYRNSSDFESMMFRRNPVNGGIWISELPGGYCIVTSEVPRGNMML